MLCEEKRLFGVQVCNSIQAHESAQPYNYMLWYFFFCLSKICIYKAYSEENNQGSNIKKYLERTIYTFQKKKKQNWVYHSSSNLLLNILLFLWSFFTRTYWIPDQFISLSASPQKWKFKNIWCPRSQVRLLGRNR
jgi:hypothetical protein